MKNIKEKIKNFIFDNKILFSIILEILLLLRFIFFYFIIIMTLNIIFGINIFNIFQEKFPSVENDYAILAISGIFIFLSFFAIPQVLLTLPVISLYGTLGIFYAYIATFISLNFTYFLGKLIGKINNKKVKNEKIVEKLLVEYGFLGSIIIRIIPTPLPFVLVNIIYGKMNIKYLHYFFGSMIGIIPKILFVGLFSTNIDELLNKDISIHNVEYFTTIFVFALLLLITKKLRRLVYVR